MTMTQERLAPDQADTANGHRFRYHLAAGFLEPGDTVVDAACGAGYGRDILKERGGEIAYVGVDQHIDRSRYGETNGVWIEQDLRTFTLGHQFDVFVGFETIEHLTDYSHYIRHAKQARRWVILSVPVVPTTHLNPYHCHNFAPGQVASLFVDEDWQLFQSVLQPSELSEIYVFGRRA